MAKITTKITDLLSASRRAASSIRDALDGLESDLIARKLELNRISSSPVDEATIAARIDRVLADAAAAAEDALILGVLSAPDADPARMFPAPTVTRLQAFSMAAMLAPETARAALISRVSAGARNGISDEFRAAETARLAGEIADLESQIEAVHREAERAGLSIPRRADADPAALLAPEGGDR